jgi:SAM-dependent methyltransferase
LSGVEFFRQLVRLTFRLWVVLVAESRDLLHPADTPAFVRYRYANGYRLSRLLEAVPDDAWPATRAVCAGLGQPGGLPALGLPELGGFLWSSAACPDLDGAQLAPAVLASVVRSFELTGVGGVELGAAYEELLEWHAVPDVAAGTVRLDTAAGHDRRTSGSYYTPASLVDLLVSSTVDPVLDEAADRPDPEAAILGLRIIDPACGAGNFLTAAARRVARRLAAVRGGDEAAALRDVVDRCVYGVDIDPVAVDLCRVALWLEAGRLASFDGRVVCADALTGDMPGPGVFDVVLGNPPWDRVRLEEREFFAVRAPEVAALSGAKRKAAIARLELDSPALWAEYVEARRRVEELSQFVRRSGRFPLCGRGLLNLFALFAERMRSMLAPTGRMGVIVPTGMVTDANSAGFIADVMARRQLVGVYDFTNTGRLFPGVHGRQRFALLMLTGVDRPCAEPVAVFDAVAPGDVEDVARRVPFTADDVALMNPNTRTLPVLRSRRDAAILRGIYGRVPVLVRDGNPWGVTFRQGHFNMTSDSHLFRIAAELRAMGAVRVSPGNVWQVGQARWLPLYEGKMAHLYDHRFGDFALRQGGGNGDMAALPDPPEEWKRDPSYVVHPRYWVPEAETLRRGVDPCAVWVRRVTYSATERTVIVSALPPVAVGNSLQGVSTTVPGGAAILLACMSSLVFDYVARQKMGGANLNLFAVGQLPVLAPEVFAGRCPWGPGPLAEWITSRVLELVYTSADMSGFAAAHGYHGKPFRWDPARRAVLRAELDAAMFHLYGLDRDDVGYVLDSFRVLRAREEREAGTFRTRGLVLAHYDMMAAMRSAVVVVPMAGAGAVARREPWGKDR